MFKLKYVFITAIILFLLKPTLLYSNQNNIPEEYNAGNTLGFVRALISKNEYYRAFIELKRLDSYYPGFIREKILITELFLLFKGARYPEILLNDFNSTDSGTKAIHSIFKVDALLENSEFVNAKELLDSVKFAGIGKDIDFYLYKRTILTGLLLNKIEETRKIIENRITGFNDIDLNAAGFPELADYSKDYYESVKKPYKAVFFGIIPGMGYFYADQRATGIIAFLLISALSAATYYSFKTDNKPAGIFMGAATTFFYGGSILGGYLASRRYNSSALNDLRDSLSQRLQLENDRENIFKAYGTGYAGQ